SLVLHRGGQSERLPARARTRVDDDLAGARVARLRDELAAFVLHLEQTLLERCKREDVGAARERKPVGRIGRRLDAGALRGGRGQILQGELAGLQGTTKQVIDAALQPEKPVHGIGDRAALHAAQCLLPAEHALHRLVRAGILPPDFFVDLEDRGPDQVGAHRQEVDSAEWRLLSTTARSRPWYEPAMAKTEKSV